MALEVAKTPFQTPFDSHHPTLLLQKKICDDVSRSMSNWDTYSAKSINKNSVNKSLLGKTLSFLFVS